MALLTALSTTSATTASIVWSPPPLPTTTTTITTPTTTTTTADSLLKLCLLWSVLNKPELSGFGDNPDFPEVSRPPLVCNDYFLYNSDNPFSDLLATTTDIIIPRTSSGKVSTLGDEEESEPKTKMTQKQKFNKLDYKYISSRSLAVIGALGGIILILLIVALTTCIRHRRELYRSDDRDRGFARDLLINHIRNFRSSARDRRIATIDPPPSYEDVIKVTIQDNNTEQGLGQSDTPQANRLEGLERSVIVSQADDDTCQPPSYQEAMASLTSVALAPISHSPSPEPNVKHHEGITTIHIE